MMVSIEGLYAHGALSCIIERNSPLADWAANIKWTTAIPNDAIDPVAETKRVATICRGIGASARDRFLAKGVGDLAITFWSGERDRR